VSLSRLLVLQTRLADLRDGQELVGTVFRQMLYHGAQIDIGADYDGCVPGCRRRHTSDLVGSADLCQSPALQRHKACIGPDVCRGEACSCR